MTNFYAQSIRIMAMFDC